MLFRLLSLLENGHRLFRFCSAHQGFLLSCKHFCIASSRLEDSIPLHVVSKGFDSHVNRISGLGSVLGVQTVQISCSCAMFPSTSFIFVGIPEGEDDELDLEVENIEVAKPLTLELAATDSRTRCH